MSAVQPEMAHPRRRWSVRPRRWSALAGAPDKAPNIAPETTTAQGDQGFTLIEVLISLSLFALIATAGFATLGGILQVRARTETEVERLADLQRAMYILTQDFSQATAAPIDVAAASIAFHRAGGSEGGGDLAVRYSLAGGALTRTLGEGPSLRAQRLLTGVAGADLRFFSPGAGWSPLWPPPGAPDARPAAVAIEISFDPAAGRPSGTVRRVIALPGAP